MKSIQHLKKIILSFLVILLISSCSKKTVIETELDALGIKPEEFGSIDTTFYKSKNIESLRFYKIKTEYVEVFFYESGKKKSIYQVKGNQCEGKYVDWFENGKEKWVRQYKNGIQIGKNIVYQENGFPEKEVDNEKKEYKNYYANGKLKETFSENFHFYCYLNGQFIEKYIKTGKDEFDVQYLSENGNVDFSGEIKSNILYKNNRRFNGKIICKFKNGKISHYEDVVNGIPNGKYYMYYGNGVLKFDAENADGKEVIYKYYYPNGKVNFIRDGKAKTFTEWDENGKLIE